MTSRLTQPPFSEYGGNPIFDAIMLVLLLAFGRANRGATYRSGGWEMRISPPRRRWFR